MEMVELPEHAETKGISLRGRDGVNRLLAPTERAASQTGSPISGRAGEREDGKGSEMKGC